MRITLINEHYIDGEILSQGEYTVVVLADTGETFSIPWTSILHFRDGKEKDVIMTTN